MSRPYIICHMVTSLDGKVTGDFLSVPACKAATDVYYEINRSRRSNGFICGRVTMEGSFTGGWYPDLSAYPPISTCRDFIPDKASLSGFYAVAFDTHGRLGWQTGRIVDPDGDPGYDSAQIVEVLSEAVDKRYLGYLESLEIPYLFAGETAIDIQTALAKLKLLLGIDTLLLEGGSIINGAFQRADAIDELSLVISPLIADKDDKPLFFDANTDTFQLVSAETNSGVPVLCYKK